jgi:hypothetical protein
VTANEFRRIALGMEGASEGQHMGHPDFRVNGRIFATLTEDRSRGMVQLTPEQQQEFMSASPDTFVRPRAPGPRRLDDGAVESVDGDTLGEAMTLAWQKAVTAKKGRRSPSPGQAPLTISYTARPELVEGRVVCRARGSTGSPRACLDASCPGH